MITRLLVFLLAVASALPSQTPPLKRPRIGLVLEGGGALGFAHIGVLQYLEQHHIPVDLVVGTSMGGLVGGLYAIGNSPAEIEQFTDGIDWDEVLSGVTPFQSLNFRRKQDRQSFPNRLQLGLKHGVTLPLGLNSGQQVSLLLARSTLAYPESMNFDNLPIAFRCVSTDITAGRMKVFENGSLARAMRATMSIPAVFSPVEIDHHLYTDGAAVDNLPVDVARKAGADIIIAVYLDPGAADTNNYDSILTVAAKNVSIMVSANELRNIQAADILLSADLQGFTSASFKDGAEIIPKGYAAAVKKHRLLDAYALDDTGWAAYLAARNSRKLTEVPVPQFVEVVGDKPNYLRSLEASLQKFVGQPLPVDELNQTVTRITGTGVIASTTYTMTTNAGNVPGLKVATYDKAYAPPFLDLGINLNGSDPNNVIFGLAARLTFMDIGGYRAEWRNDAFFGSTYGVRSEYYRPLTSTSKWFVAPRIYAISSPFNIYSGQAKLAQYRTGQDGFGLDFGYALNRRSEIRFGEDLLWFKSVKKVADDSFPNLTQREAASNIRYRYFGVDNIELPRQGLNVDAGVNRYERGNELGSFTQAELRVSYFQKVSAAGSLIFTANGGSSFKTNSLDLLLQAFSLGGPLRFGSYGENELLGSQYFLFQAGYEHKLLPLSPLLGEGVYALTLFEAGKVYDPLNVSGNPIPVDGSLAIVARTSLGPLFVGGSFGDNSHRKWWFGLGRVF